MGSGASVKGADEVPLLGRGESTASLTKTRTHALSSATSFFRRISMGSLTSLLSWEKAAGKAHDSQEDSSSTATDRPKTFEERLESVDLTGLLVDGDVTSLYFFSDNMLSKRTKVVIRLVSHKRTEDLRACKQHNLRKADRSCKHERSPDLIKKQVIMLNECCDHPNIIQLCECFTHNGYLYEILEYASGPRLFQAILEAESHTEQETANIVIQLIAAVNHMHQRRVCHRDIKPEHILFKELALPDKAVVKLVDFATACLFTEEPMTEKVTTPYYASPQVHEGLYTESLDVWSCGVAMYLLLTGYPRKAKAAQEFPNMRGDDFMKTLTKGKMHSMQERGDHISREANHLLDNLLLTSEEHRITPARAIRNAWLQSHAPQHIPQDKDEESSDKRGDAAGLMARDRAGMVY